MKEKDNSYYQWIAQLKEKIRSAQLKAAVTVNAQLLKLYWELGIDIIEQEKSAVWGKGFLSSLANDLQREFPAVKGFSLTNLKYIRLWVNFYFSTIGQQYVDQLPNRTFKSQQPVDELKSETEKGKTRQQAVAQMGVHDAQAIPSLLATIPWGHHLQIITKCKLLDEALFYIQQTCTNNWSRAVLVVQIESGLYKRKGKALTNFETTLPRPQSDLANALLKNPYQFDFLSLGEEASERDLENALASHLTKFLLELGAGFAYMGRQHRLVVDEQDFFIDLLFYHTQLHCYVVAELKIDEFKPEYAGKLNFYLNAIDAQLKQPTDEPTIGLLLCKKAGKLIVEYSLKSIHKPIGVSEYKLVEALPKKLKGSLPSIEDIEDELTQHA